MPKVVIGVMGAGESATPVDLELAYELGRQIALCGWVTLSGGRDVGVMDAVSRGAKQENGLTIGILPHQCSSMSAAIDIPIVTDLGNGRNNVNVLSSRVVVACGMGAGTASEVALAIKARKTVILLNVDHISQQFFQQLSQERVIVVGDVEQAIEAIHQRIAD